MRQHCIFLFALCALLHVRVREASSAVKLVKERFEGELKRLGKPQNVQDALSVHATAFSLCRTLKSIHGHVDRSSANVRSLGRIGQSGKRFSPVAYGADPTGVKDSSPAFDLLLRDFLNATSINGKSMASNIKDLGGAIIDLGGGQFKLTSPIVIPPMFGNAHIIQGTLRAASSFPSDRWLVEIGDAATCKPTLPSGKPDGQGSCGEFINVDNILFDAAFTAAGGIKVDKVMGTTISTAFVTGFTDVGIKIDAGHEVMVTDAWLAECYWSDHTRCSNSSSIGIQINGNDHYLTDVIVFDYAKIGVEINGAANVLTAVHTWNGGGTGISLGTKTSTYGAHQNRLIGCYLDYNTLDMFDPSSVVIESTFFLSTHAVLHAVKGSIDGLTMRYNTYTTPQSVVLDGTFGSVKGVLISEETGAAKATRATKSLYQQNASSWTFDFTSELLFPDIDQVSYSVTSDSSSFFNHMARPPQGGKVTIVTSEPVDATVVVAVTQGV